MLSSERSPRSELSSMARGNGGAFRIAFHGFGAFPQFFRAVVEVARAKAVPIEWAAIMPTSTHVKMMRGLLGSERVLELQPLLTERVRKGVSIETLSRYPGSIFRDIETDKRSIRFRSGERQLAVAIAVYEIYRDFLARVQPSHVFFANCETYEGMILAAAARELNIGTIGYCHGRVFGESFLHDGVVENLPEEAQASDPVREKARRFLRQFRTTYVPAASIPELDDDAEVLPVSIPPLWKRATRFGKQFLAERENRYFDAIRARFLNNAPFIRDAVWGLRKAWNSRYFDIARFEDLPPRFIYYPLQYSPESSINIPAPYFVDQTRAIDLIRFSMPSDMLLVVKEHPACILLRPGSFVRALQKKAGVVVAKYSMDSRELVRRAALTISVTGTSGLEAFLYGRPSLLLGPAFFESFLGGRCSPDDLSTRIGQALGANPGDDAIVEAIAKVFSISAPFVLFSPDHRTASGRVTMSRANVEMFLEALQRFASRRAGFEERVSTA